MQKERFISAIRLLVSTVLVSGCAVNVNIPANRFESPESLGPVRDKGKVEMGGGLGGSNNIIFSQDFTLYPIEPATPPIQRAVADVYVTGGIGLLDKFDLGARYVTHSSPLLIFAKYQFLGPAAPDAKAGDTSFAATLGGGFTSKSGSSSLGGDVTGYELGIISADAAVIGGYRIADHLLAYGGPFVTNSWISGSRNVTPFGSSVESTSLFSATALQPGGNLGVMFGTGPVLKLEGTFAHASVGSVSKSNFYFGVELAFRN